MKGRVKGLLGGVSPLDGPAEQTDVPSDPSTQRQALQVLTLAQRTAEEHVASAHHQADKICADARATAEQIARDAQAHADELQRNADKALAAAQARAAEIAKDAQANADELKHQAQQRYQDVVGSLAAKREALQQQIEALEQFDRDYRSRLTAFMQTQLRALWVDEPHVDAEAESLGAEPATEPAPAQGSHSRRS
jgi:vacuolar-type H+-ATPase subunit H